MLFYSVVKDSIPNFLLLAESGGFLFEESTEIFHRLMSPGSWQPYIHKVPADNQAFTRLVRSKYSDVLASREAFSHFTDSHPSADERAALPMQPRLQKHPRPVLSMVLNNSAISDGITVKSRKISKDPGQPSFRESMASQPNRFLPSSRPTSSVNQIEFFAEDFRIEGEQRDQPAGDDLQSSPQASTIKVPMKQPFAFKHLKSKCESTRPSLPEYVSDRIECEASLRGGPSIEQEPTIGNKIMNSNLCLRLLGVGSPKTLRQDCPKPRAALTNPSSQHRQAQSERPGLFLVPDAFSSCLDAQEYTDLQLHLDMAFRQKVNLVSRKSLVYEPLVGRLVRSVVPALSLFEAAASRLAQEVVACFAQENPILFFDRAFDVKRVAAQALKLHLSLHQLHESVMASFADRKEFLFVRKAVLASPFTFTAEAQNYLVMDLTENLEKCLSLENYNFSAQLAKLLLSGLDIRAAASFNKPPDVQLMDETKRVGVV